MGNCLIDFSVIKDERGSLIALEELKNIPFNIKRVYYMYDLDRQFPRGFHAHKNLKQILLCINGSCLIKIDDGNGKKEFRLNQQNQGLLIDNMVWREMHDFSDDCVLMILASEYYDENDYIRDYHTFLKKVHQND